MPLLNVPVGRAALFVDLDGTLAPIVADPALVGPEPERNALLARAQRELAGRLAVLSGRSIADLDRILEGQVERVGGLHGLERRMASGVVLRPEAASGVSLARAEAMAFAERHRTVLLEDKGLSLALHFRADPSLEGAVGAFAHDLAGRAGLCVQHGKMVSELRMAGPHKGDALLSFMKESPFEGSVPIFVGDDLTDEHAFESAAMLGGCGVLVGAPRETSARGRLKDPEAVVAWIATSLDAGSFEIED
jgi:trehalose 6-phosphate phosphatase